MRKLVLDKAAIKKNLFIVKEKAGEASIFGVLSGDGGGAGTLEMARLLRDCGVRRFAVREYRDARILRDNGFVDEDILMLTSTTQRERLEKLLDLNVIFTISSVDTGLALNALAENRSTVVEAHIQVDSGLGFGGFLVGEPEKILLCYRSLSNVALSGIYTQVLSAPRQKNAKQQLDIFREVMTQIHTAGYETGTVHAADSHALLHYESARMNAVRAGSILLGRCRGAEKTDLRAVGFGEAPLSECRWLPRGHTVGCGRSVTLRRPTRVAVIPVGYHHGFGIQRPRNNGLLALLQRWRSGQNQYVRIGGQRAKIIGQIGAEETVVDVSDLKCAAGDIATFDLDPIFAKGFQREYR